MDAEPHDVADGPCALLPGRSLIASQCIAVGVLYLVRLFRTLVVSHRYVLPKMIEFQLHSYSPPL